jgi:hypothetical protein
LKKKLTGWLKRGDEMQIGGKKGRGILLIPDCLLTDTYQGSSIKREI